VTDVDGQVSQDFTQTALALHDADQVSAGKLTEWFFCSRPTIEAYLSRRYFEVESLIA
jgi:hypothetical protein